MNPLIFFFFLSIFLEDYFFREGKFIKYYLYLIGFYSVFYYFQHRSTFHSHSKKFNMAAFDQSFDSTVYARVKFNISKAKEYLKKLSEKPNVISTFKEYFLIESTYTSIIKERR